MDTNPVVGLEVAIEPTIDLFEYVRSTRRKLSTQRGAQCRYLQSRALEAHVYVATNRHTIGQSILDDAYHMRDGCILCEADYLRRYSKLYGSWKRWDEAQSTLDRAIGLYREIPDSGHDLHHNGMANCFFSKTMLVYCTLGPEAGAQVAREGLEITSPRLSPTLFSNFVFALAKCLQPSQNPTEVQLAHELLNWYFENTEMAKQCSAPRVMLLWLRGLLLSAQRDLERALEDLTLALEDAHALQLGQEVSAILSDIGALLPDPREVRNHIEDFCDWNEKGDLLVPDWFGDSLESEVQTVYHLTLNTSGSLERSIFKSLRQTAGGEALMPTFLIPSAERDRLREFIGGG